MHRPKFDRRRALAATIAGVVSFAPLQQTLAQVATPGPSPAPALPPLPDAPERPDGPLAVVTTLPVLADIVRQVGGARVEASSLLPANVDPHEYEPAPDDIVRIEEADLVVEHGLELDAWAADLIAGAGRDDAVIATQGITPYASDTASGAGDSPSGDPHVWFDPANVVTMADTIGEALKARDPDGANAYAARNAAYDQQLAALDGWIAAQIATIPPARRKLVTNHDALGYYVRRYGLTFVGAVIPSFDTRAEPSAKETAALIEKIEAEGVPAIFTEASLNPELEQELASQAGVKVVPNLYADNLGAAGSGADTYIGMMVTDTNLIVAALR